MREFARGFDPPSQPAGNRRIVGQTSNISDEKHCPMDSAFSSRRSAKLRASSAQAERQPMVRVSGIALQAMKQNLDPLSLNLLRFLLQFSVATTDQLRRQFYWDRVSRHAGELACWRALHRLQQHQLIHCLPRQAGGLNGGSTPAVWYATNPGHRFIQMTDSHEASTQHATRIRGNEPPALVTLHHRLTVTETYVQLHELQTSGRLDMLEFAIEPHCWRQFYGSGGSRIILKPDAATRMALSGSDYEHLWFLEIDMGSESQAIIRRKAEVYEAYRRTGLEQTKQGVFPMVMWITPDEQRERQLNTIFESNHLSGGHTATALDQFIALTTRE